MKPWMSTSEYEANKNGLNIFFGAIIGVVMAGVEDLTAFEFGMLLMIAGGFVVSLLYIGASRRRIMYAVYAAVMLAGGWWMAVQGADLLSLTREWLITRMLPAFTVWYVMVLVVEFAPREKTEAPVQ